MTVRSHLFIILILLKLVRHSTSTEEINSKRFKDLIKSGKNGMIKFYQPWHGHCTRMKPDWDQLAEEWDSSVFVFIADVNCAEQRALCEYYNVNSYPSVMYWINQKQHDYNRGRGFEALHDFVHGELVVKCNVSSLSPTCSEKSLKYFDKWNNKVTGDVDKEIARLESMGSKNEMTSSIKNWMRERLLILSQISTREL